LINAGGGVRFVFAGGGPRLPRRRLRPGRLQTSFQTSFQAGFQAGDVQRHGLPASFKLEEAFNSLRKFGRDLVAALLDFGLALGDGLA
jgi:hypothetical protein